MPSGSSGRGSPRWRSVVTLIGFVCSEVQRLDDRLDTIDARLRAVEVELGKVVQRLATLERLHLPSAGGGD